MLGLVDFKFQVEPGVKAVKTWEKKTVGFEKPSRMWRMKNWFKLLLNGSLFIPFFALMIRRVFGVGVFYGELFGLVEKDGKVINYGLLSRKLVTDAGVAYLTADMAGGGSDINLFKFHGFGSGTTAENANQTALITEFTTEYAVNSTRPTGSQSSSTNTYTTVGTLSPDASVSVAEHGIFNATSAGTLWDRSTFTAIALTSADSLQATYVATFPAGS